MLSHLCVRIPAWLLAAVVVLSGCDGSEHGTTVTREGEPDYIVTKNNSDLDRAVDHAKTTYPQLIAAFKGGDPNHQGFAIKKPFPATDVNEHIWLTLNDWDGSVFTATVDNEPVDTNAVAYGDVVKVKPEELSDWMYLDGNRIVGGYTIRVLHYQSSPEEQDAFIEQTGLEIPPIDF